MSSSTPPTAYDLGATFPSADQNARQRQVQVHIPDEERGLMAHEERRQPDPVSPGGRSTSTTRHQIAELLRLKDNKERLISFWDQFNRKGREKVGVLKSLRNLALCSWLNIFLILIPLSWLAHFEQEKSAWGHQIVFIISLFAIIPLEHSFEYGGDQMRCYLGKDLGDIVVITLNNAVEATLGVILLVKCELILLKSTIIGVVILHLLLIPGVSFAMGGARIIQQDLHPHLTQLNHSMLTIGVLSLLLPFAFFTAVNSSFHPAGADLVSPINDAVRDKILDLSRGLAVLLLIVYICSRIYLHNPPGDELLLLYAAPNAPAALKQEAEKYKEKDPELNQWVCIIMLLVSLGLMATTAEWLVKSIEPVRENGDISEIWFGLILLPLVSFAADGVLAVGFFVRRLLRHFFKEPVPPTTLAHAEAIDLSIQFILFWMPLYVLIGWGTGKPLTLLFDMFEVALLIGSCFLVNYVTADSKTNWAEGSVLVIFYVMIGLCAWYYEGQAEVSVMSTCGTVAAAITSFIGNGGGDMSGVPGVAHLTHGAHH